MSAEIVLVLALMGVVLILFSLEKVPVDAVAVGMVLALLATRVLTPAEALAGFGSEVVVVLGGLFVLSAGLRASGALEIFGQRARRLAGRHPRRALAVLLMMVAALSAFMNNTTCTAVFLPVALAVARGGGLAPSRVLMPMAFASILGGSLTLVGTSTNVIVGGLLPSYGQAPLGMFELLPAALPVAAAGIVYLLLAAPRLLPEHREEGLEQAYHLGEYLAEVEVLRRSPLVGRRLEEVGLGERWGLNLLALVRRGEVRTPSPRARLDEGDVLLVEGTVDTLARLAPGRGLAIRRSGGDPALSGAGLKLVEAVVLPRSELVGRTLKETRFRQRYGAGVVALNRHGEAAVEKLGHIRLRVGDLLLLQGSDRALEQLRARRGLLLLGERATRQPSGRAAGLAAAVFVLVILLGATATLPLAGAVLLGCLLLLATRCLTSAEAYAAVDWRLLVLIAGMIAYGTALTKSGAAALLAEAAAALGAGLGPLALLAAFYGLTVALTQPMSNQAAALVVLPVAMGVAAEAGLNPRAMAVTVALAASSSFLTPLEPSCLLVYGPGRYRFSDYARLGAGLTLIALILTLAVVPRLWPLSP